MAKVSIKLGRTIADVNRAARKADKQIGRSKLRKVVTGKKGKKGKPKAKAKGKELKQKSQVSASDLHKGMERTKTHARMQNMPKEYTHHMKDTNYAKAMEQHRKKGHTWESSHDYAKKVSGRLGKEAAHKKAMEGYKAHKPVTTIHENRGKEVANLKGFKRAEGVRKQQEAAKGLRVSAQKAKWQQAGKANKPAGFAQSKGTIYGNSNKGGPTPTPMAQAIHAVKSTVKGGMQKLRQVMAPPAGSKDYNQTWKQRKEASEMGKKGMSRKISNVANAWGHAHDLMHKGMAKVGRMVKGAIGKASGAIGKTAFGKDMGTLKQRLQPIAKGWDAAHNMKKVGTGIKTGLAKAGGALKTLRKKTLGFQASKRLIALSR